MRKTKAIEYNFDGLIGPTHNFGGLSFGNLACETNRFAVSNAREAALQGLRKMRLLHEMGVKQGLLPPHERPNIGFLRQQGYSGTDRQILERVSRSDPELLLICSSASPMWTANAATVSPSADTEDGRVHITTANLLTQKHRAIEPPQTEKILRLLFAQKKYFACHPPLEDNGLFADEGAANHLRLAPGHGEAGLEIFVYGKKSKEPSQTLPKKYPARQSLAASVRISENHRLASEQVVFAKQNPEIIDR